jgi:hypothetical protein
MCYIATLRYEGIDEIEMQAAATTKNGALGRLYDKMSRNGNIKEFESNYGEFLKNDAGYKRITQDDFTKYYREIGEKQGCEIKVVKG